MTESLDVEAKVAELEIIISVRISYVLQCKGKTAL